MIIHLVSLDTCAPQLATYFAVLLLEERSTGAPHVSSEALRVPGVAVADFHTQAVPTERQEEHNTISAEPLYIPHTHTCARQARVVLKLVLRTML